VRSLLLKKIINKINDNDFQKKKKENNVKIFGLEVTNDDIDWCKEGYY
jgi:hypothetical protein